MIAVETVRPRPAVVGAAAAEPPRRPPLLGFALVDLGGLALAAEATGLGWTERLLAGDSTGTSRVVVGMLAAGLVLHAVPPPALPPETVHAPQG